MDEPGLLLREIIRVVGDKVRIREKWDVTVPDCPVKVFKLGTFEEVPGVLSVERYTIMPLAQARELSIPYAQR